MRLATYRSGHVWLRQLRVFRHLWKSDLWPPFIEPFIALAALGLGLGAFVSEINGQSYLQFIAPGVAVMFPMFTATFECTYGVFFRMDRDGIYDAILSTPVSIEDIVAGELMWSATRTTLSGVAILVMIVLFGATNDFSALLFIPAVFLIGLMFSAMAMAFTSIAPTLNFLGFYFTLFITPMFWASGVFFPIDSLPDWLQVLTWLVPLSHAVELSRSIFGGALSLETLGHLAWIVVVTIAFYVISTYAMRRRLVR